MNPQTVALNPAALIAAHQRRSAFVPAVGGKLVVTFPGETMRCTVESVIDDDTAFIRVDSPPISRGHSFQFDRVYGVRRRFKLDREVWEAQTENDFMAEQAKQIEAREAANPRPRKAKAAEPIPVEPVVAEPVAKAAPKKKPQAKKAAKKTAPAKRKKST